MRLKLVIFLILVLALCALAGKQSDKEKAEPDRVKKSRGVKEHRKDAEGVEYKDLSEVEHEAGVDDDDDQEEEEEEEEPPKKVPKKHQKNKEKKLEKEKVEKSEKGKKSDPEIIAKPETAAIPNMTSFDFLEDTRDHRIDKLREIINESPTGNIEKMRQITEDLKKELSTNDDDNEYEACTGTENELCHCDMHEINCSEITMDSDDIHLHTADVRIQDKNFIPVIANFSENAIGRLKNERVLPGFEKHVSTLDLSHNKIRFIDSDVFKPFTNLSKLDLSHNNIQTIKKPYFDTVKDTLHKLNLGYNRIKTIPDNVFEGLTNLKKLSLDGNPIKNWKKEMFKGLDNLEEISLDGCKIEDLPSDIFQYLPKLTGISLRENPIEEVPALITHIKTLKIVDLSITNLTEIRDHVFSGDSDLEEIILEKMPYLSVVRDCGFCGVPHLKVLLLNDNVELMEVHPNAFGFVKSDPGHKASAITQFEIHNSNLTTISEHMMDFDKLATFKIGGNPWKCGCDTQFLLEEKFSFKADSVSPKCASPESLKDRHLATVHVTEACEDARFLGRSGRFSSVLGLALLAGFIAIGSYYMVSSGKLERLVRKVRKEPEVSYTNLQAAGEDFALETDFQPRPAEV